MISSVLINDEGRKGMKAGGYNSPLLKGRERGERSFRRKEKWESFETLIGLGLGALSLKFELFSYFFWVGDAKPLH